MRPSLFVLVLCAAALPAQNARIAESGQKTLLTVPMIGKGTWDDPKRPAFVQEAGIPFRFQVSDDGTMALVEAAPSDLAQMAKLTGLVSKDGRAKMFRPEKDKKDDVVAEFKKLKKDFDPELFGLRSLTKLLPNLPVIGK